MPIFLFRKLTLSLAKSILISDFSIASLLSKKGVNLFEICFCRDILVFNSNWDSYIFICTFANPIIKYKTI